MRILFLDVDGVLNNAESLKNQIHLDRSNVEHLGRIVKEGKIELVVLSSVWRMMGEASFRFRDLRRVLREFGVEIHSKTPRLDDIRGFEIDQWLKHQRATEEEILILDDDNDFLDWQKDRLVQTNGLIGLTAEDAATAIRILESPSW
jgi:hypothetical protein